MRTSRLLAAVPVLLGLTVVAGCGPSVPEGYVETTQGQLRLVVPEGWVAGETSGDVDLVRQDAAGDDPAVRLAAMSDYPDTSARGAINQILTFQVLGVPDSPGGLSEVDGDSDMWRYDATVDGGAAHVVAWALCDSSKDACVMVTISGKSALDEKLLSTVQDSIQIVDAADEG